MGSTKSFQVGDQVIRSGYALRAEPNRIGEVVEVYRSTPNGRNECDTMYAVRWRDNGQVTRGYLAVGLDHYFQLPPILLPGVK
jgi:hypothetical protein